MFSSQSEAKAFFVDKIVAQAQAEGRPLSENERWMLGFSEFDTDFVVDPARVEQFEAEIQPKAYEAKIAGLVRRAYQRDVKAHSDAQISYREASTTLHQGDHYLLIMIDRALGRVGQATTGNKLMRAFAQSGLFIVLLLPGSVGILLACGIAWATLTQGARSPDAFAGPLLGSLALGGGGYYLIYLWRRESKKR